MQSMLIPAFAMQPALGGVSAAPRPAAEIHNYLKGAESRQPCDEGQAGGEIVVCGRKTDDEVYRLRAPDDRAYAPAPVRAEVAIADGVTVRASAAETALMNGERKSEPDKPSARYAKEPRITLTIPLSALK